MHFRRNRIIAVALVAVIALLLYPTFRDHLRATSLLLRIEHPVGVLGLSFCGGLALMADADERYKPDIAFVVSVGGHDAMARVARFLASGKTARPDGSSVTMLPHEYGALVLVYSQVSRFF